MLKFIAELVGVILVVCLFLAALARVLEPRFAFFPTAGETMTPDELGVEYEPVPVVTRDGEQLRGWLLPHTTPRAHVVYFHGNGGNLSMWAPILVGIARHGYSVLAYDYRGYGLSTGRPTERGLYRDIDAVVEAGWRRVRPTTPVVYWGRSLGAAMAAYAATVRPPDGVILESGFPDARSLLQGMPALAFLALFSTYRFPVVEFLQRVTVPVLVMHGDEDHVIPFAHGRALFERISGPKQFVTIRGGDHNDLVPADQQTYWESIGAFAVGLSTSVNPRTTPNSHR